MCMKPAYAQHVVYVRAKTPIYEIFRSNNPYVIPIKTNT